MNLGRILLVEDEAVARENLAHILTKQGHKVSQAPSGEAALELLAVEEFDLVLTDVRMRDVSGLMVLAEAKRLYPDCEVVVMTGYATVDSAVEAMRGGACHYLTKPFSLDELRAVVAEAMDKRRLKLEVARLSGQVEKLGRGPLIIGESPAIERMRERISQVAPSDSSVLILGETGSGKELAARAIHAQSRRSDKRFVAINCGAYGEELFANELFGHEKGAFSGAVGLKKGLIEVAGQGTLFLDESGELSGPMQARLLRALQERRFYRVGGEAELNVNCRILAATNKDLKAEVERGGFRADLFYRLNVIGLRVPSLAERARDIPLLAGFFLAKYAPAMGKRISGISGEALRQLTSYPFPGNIRELENIVQHAVILAKGENVELGDLPSDLRAEAVEIVKSVEVELVSLEELERRHIALVLEHCQGNKTKAAEILGIDRVSLWRKLKRHGLGE